MVIRKIIVIVLLLLVIPATSYAQEVSPAPKPVEYVLPHPGLLPHHPLYFLRAVRDTMQTFFTSDPVKKAEFYHLQADKGVSASIMLAEQKETLELAGATAVESQEYFEKALEEVGNAKKQGLAIDEITKKLVLANEKHQEMLTLVTAGVPEEHKERFIKAGKKAKNAEKRVKAILPTN